MTWIYRLKAAERFKTRRLACLFGMKVTCFITGLSPEIAVALNAKHYEMRRAAWPPDG